MSIVRLGAKAIDTTDPVLGQVLASTDGVSLGRRNMLFNGAMRVYQRGSQSTSAGANTYFVDRFNVYIAATAAATVSQDTDVPTGQGFTKSAKIDVTTADTSLGATDLGLFRQPLEGDDLQHLLYGTSNAKQLTMSFWVKSSKTGTHLVELYNAASGGARQVSKAYTINSANTWEFKSITIDGDTTRGFDTGVTAELYVQWVLYAGTNYTGGTLNTSWADAHGANETNRYVGQVNIFDNTSNNFYVTGAQLEVGGSNSEFEHRPIAQEELDCYRYFYKITRNDPYGEFLVIRTYSSTQGTGVMILPAPMRVQPTFTSTSVSGNFSYGMSVLAMSTTDISSHRLATHNAVGAFTANGAAVVQKANNTDLVFMQYDAEL